MMTTAEAEVGVVPGEWPKDTRTIHERMLAILDELPAIGKDQRNTQQKFMYRGHDDVMAALNPLLGKHGVYLVPRVVSRKTAERTTRSNTILYEVDLHVEFTFYGAAGDKIVASTWGEGTDSGDKSTNKAMTMAFKNVLAIAFAISTHELSDADATSPEETVARGQAAGGRRSRSNAPREIDPGIELLPGAIEGEDFVPRIASVLNTIGPNVDWRATLAPFLRERFHVESREEIPAGDLMVEYWRRLANFVAKIVAEEDVESFPPVVDREPDKVLASLRWAFSSNPEGATIVLTLNTEAVASGTEDVPWVDEVQQTLDKQKQDEPVDEAELDAAEEAARAAVEDSP